MKVYKIGRRQRAKEEKMNTNAKYLAGVERATILENGKAELLRTRTHTLCSLENKLSINFYALLKLYARDG